MNQILVTKKMYMTPNIKRKKNFFKFYFFMSIFLICILCSYYIYAEYDRNKSEQVSQQILSQISFTDNTTIPKEEAIVVFLDEEATDEINIIEIEQEEENQEAEQTVQEYKSKDGSVYYTVAVVNIPKINVNYPVLSKTSDELLKVSPCKFWGPNPNEVGNFCIVGHNYRNNQFFSKVPSLVKGDIVELTDLYGVTVQYKVYDKYTVEPDDVRCTSQLTKGKREVTLITCTNDNKKRVVVKAREI